MLLCLLRALAEFSLLSLFAKLTPFSRKPCFPFRAIGGENAVFTIIYDLCRNFRAWRACSSEGVRLCLRGVRFALCFACLGLCMQPVFRALALSFCGENRHSLLSVLISRAPGNVSGVEGRAVRPFTPECPSPVGTLVRCASACFCRVRRYCAAGGLSSVKSVPCVCATLR